MHGKKADKEDDDENDGKKKPKDKTAIMAEIGEHIYQAMMLCKEVKESDDADSE